MPKQIIVALKHLIETFSISDSSMQGWGTTQSVGMPMCNIAVAEYYLTSSQVGCWPLVAVLEAWNGNSCVH